MAVTSQSILPRINPRAESDSQRIALFICALAWTVGTWWDMGQLCNPFQTRSRHTDGDQGLFGQWWSKVAWFCTSWICYRNFWNMFGSQCGIVNNAPSSTWVDLYRRPHTWTICRALANWHWSFACCLLGWRSKSAAPNSTLGIHTLTASSIELRLMFIQEPILACFSNMLLGQLVVVIWLLSLPASRFNKIVPLYLL